MRESASSKPERLGTGLLITVLTIVRRRRRPLVKPTVASSIGPLALAPGSISLTVHHQLHTLAALAHRDVGSPSTRTRSAVLPTLMAPISLQSSALSGAPPVPATTDQVNLPEVKWPVRWRTLKVEERSSGPSGC